MRTFSLTQPSPKERALKKIIKRTLSFGEGRVRQKRVQYNNNYENLNQEGLQCLLLKETEKKRR
jgi:hypothetical protein